MGSYWHENQGKRNTNILGLVYDTVLLVFQWKWGLAIPEQTPGMKRQ